MINQRAYPDIILGNGNSSQTIALYGCFFISILDALNNRGYSFSVYQFNELMKSKDAFYPPNLISFSRLSQKMPDIFLEGRNEPWDDQKVINYLNDKENYIVIGEVDGRGIGGNAQHFVKLDRVDVSNGRIIMTYIDDPWDGLEDQKVTTRYNRYGNILSLRVFKIKKLSGGDMPNMYKGYDLSNQESMKVAVDILVRVQSGEFVEKKYKEERDLIFSKLDLSSSDDVNSALYKIGELNNRPSKNDLNKAVDDARKAEESECANQIKEFGEGLRADFEVEKEKAITEAVEKAKEEWEENKPPVTDPDDDLPNPDEMTVWELVSLIIKRLGK